MTAYYNEFDPFAAAWLRNLIAAGHIAPGDVDERSIEDVSPDDLRPYTQCHFFAGIGVWSYALRRAGWDDDRPIWTGSCPCQPFSAAGKGGGFADERHLWPAFFHLIEQCDPAIVIGEQVASKDGLAWLDLVRADVEGTGRAFAAADLCAAGFGAPHIRQRSFWLAYASHVGVDGRRDAGQGWRDEHSVGSAAIGLADASNDGHRQHRHGLGGTSGASEREAEQRQRVRADPAYGSAAIGLDDDDDARSQGHPRHDRATGGRQEPGRPAAASGVSGGLADAESPRSTDGSQDARSGGSVSGEGQPLFGVGHNGAPSEWTGSTNGFWRDADWLFCRDGKWRPVEPGTFPLAHGASSRVGRLRAYGNAIIAPVAEGFIEAAVEAIAVASLLT